ncbi:cupin domain-containing protein [Micromonospora sp. NPDC049559]|uniref:cupin domain-containing protein n=1 Tax=Micromonospora sp. NPDC049559 TaxID=3155923 RepID=UPI0034237716
MSNDDQTPEPVLRRAYEVEHLGQSPNSTWLLADADETGGVMNAVRTKLGPGTDGPPPHYHKESPELFFMLDGALRVLTGERIVTIRKGDFLLVPPHLTHAWGTPGGVGADVLIIKAPGNNRFDYFRLADRIRRGEASPKAVLETQERFDNHFVESAVWRQALAADGTGRRSQLVEL